MNSIRPATVTACFGCIADDGSKRSVGAHIQYAKVALAEGPPRSSMEHLEGARLRVGSGSCAAVCQPERSLGTCIRLCVRLRFVSMVGSPPAQQT